MLTQTLRVLLENWLCSKTMGGQLSPPLFFINRGDNMLISTLVQNINSQLAGELLSIGELTVFIDKAIDDVNTRLNTRFPTLSETVSAIQANNLNGVSTPVSADDVISILNQKDPVAVLKTELSKRGGYTCFETNTPIKLDVFKTADSGLIVVSNAVPGQARYVHFIQLNNMDIPEKDMQCLKRPIVFEYVAIPDKYIRTVIVPGAVFKYYTTDEEGAAVAPKYEEEFLKGLFYMERDYLNLVPAEYQESLDQGWVQGDGILETDVDNRQGGLTIDGSVFQL